jgi:hypothetical protein
MTKHALRSILILSPLFVCTTLFAQSYDKVWFDKSDSAYGYYVVIKPFGPRVQGAVVLLDGYGGNATSMLPETKIPNVALINDMATVCIPSGPHIFLDDAHALIIKNILTEVSRNYGINKNRFAIGGFSAGGVIALRYAELCHQHPEEFDIRPAAIFTGDSPIDLLGLYQSSKRELGKNFKGWWLGEARMIIDSLDKACGSLPAGIDNYRKLSPFMASDSLPGNEKWIVSVPYRTYHDVDVEWQLKNRHRSIYEMNMLNASELVNRLQEEGSTQAEFVASKIPGRRSNGQMHPHSWNIIDETDLISWIKEKLNFYPGDLSKRYSYPAEGWQQEIILLPFDFAPALPYMGYEDLRFSPGWGKADSEEKWAYTLVWWLDDHYVFDENVLKGNLESYFSGLNKRRAIADKDDMKSYFPARASIKKVDTAKEDTATFSGTIHIYDAQVTKKPADLYAKIHVKSCSDQQKTILLIEVSGFPAAHPVWQKLDKINTDFSCSTR